MNNGIPLVEVYRPTHINDIVLDPLNKRILTNIIETSTFPNLLFYGPPGTGKTTTIINLINAYQQQNERLNKNLIIHLNASDERGIDIIRNQISSFVNSSPLFDKGMKFVILDEVDYMTKNAVQALRYLLQNYKGNVRFCLICNYISKIDEGLQNEFIKLRFNQLPQKDIIRFLKHISDSEKLQLSDDALLLIQKNYKSDIRSMVNYIQTNQDIINLVNTGNNTFNNFKIINNDIWENLLLLIKQKTQLNKINLYIYNLSVTYNVDKKNIIKDFLNYIIRNKPHLVTNEFLSFVENIMHVQYSNNYNINYCISCLSDMIK